jgi:polyhydroxybutyrate depolymerase
MRFVVLLSCLLSLAFPLAAETVRLGDRSYEIVLPASPRGAPLILALHGGGGDPDQFAKSSGFGRAAVAAGYAVAFPAGTGRRGDRILTWNAGYCCGPALRNQSDDLGFLMRVIRDAQDRFGLGDRVYMTGMSNGSMMAQSFAARNPGLLRAVAGVSGTMDTSRIRLGGPVPALILHGTADAMVPYGGGKGDSSLTRTSFASVASVAQAFLAPWGQGLTMTEQRIDRRDDGTAAIVADYRKGDKVVLRLITIEGGGHNWPGGRKARRVPANTGAMTEEIDANTEILRFFALHP